jgi:hypothetical protein
MPDQRSAGFTGANSSSSGMLRATKSCSAM